MKKIAVFLLCLSMLSASAVVASAEEEPNIAPGKATIGTEVPDSHEIIITVKGNVDFTLNGKTGTEFEVERLSKPVIEIKAKAGEKITKVTLNGEDITDKLVDGKYTLPPIYEDGAYDVQVETEDLPADDSSKPDNSQGDKTSPVNDNPNTGVIGGLSIGSGLVLAALVMARRKGKDNEE